MICPNCKYDHDDVPKDKVPGYVYEVDKHSGMSFIRRGRVCTRCNFIYETIEKATGLPYHKRTPGELPNQTKMDL